MAAAAELTNQAVNEPNTLTMINASIKSNDRLKERSSNQNVTVLNTDLEGIVSPQSQQSKELQAAFDPDNEPERTGPAQPEDEETKTAPSDSK